MTKFSAKLLATVALASLSTAVCAQGVTPPSPFKNVDANGVDLTDGSFNLSVTSGSIGDGAGQIALVTYFGGAKGDNLQAFFKRTVTAGQATIVITIGNRSETFTGTASGTTFAASQGNGKRLTKLTDALYQYDDPGISSTQFGWPQGLSYGGGVSSLCSSGNQSDCELVARTTSFPDNNITTYDWRAVQSCAGSTCTQYFRPEAVSNGFGYRVGFGYQSDSYSGSGAPSDAWRQRVSATFSNLEVSHTPPVASFAQPSSNVVELTDTAGRMTRVTLDASGKVTAVKRPGAVADSMTVAYSGTNVSSVLNDGVTTNYARTLNGNLATMVVADALSGQATVVSDMTKYRPVSVTDQLGRATTFSWDANSRLTETVRPEGDKALYAYDARGNTLSVTNVAKAGSGLADIVTSANYAATCTNTLTCDKPIWTRDAKGNQTDYAYDPSRGVVTSITRPAAPNGIRPETRFQYGFKNGILVPTSISQCQTLASCQGLADESAIYFSYSGTNRQPTIITRQSGNGSVSAVTTLGYDAIGNVITVDGPLNGTADTTRYRYDAMRQTVGVIGPDPDGAGSRKHLAQRFTYNADGQITLAETGNVNSQSDPDWAAMTVSQATAASYDANARPVKAELKFGTTVYALNQTSYDALGRIDCAVTRTDPAVWAGQTNACAPQTAGSNGPDRITKLVYDAASQVTQVQTGVGTADAGVEVANTYTLNGALATLTDGEANRTTYEYDGHDRFAKTRFPLPTQGANASSTTDYEQLSYDANGNVTQRRLRDANVLNYSYDSLDRRTLTDTPGLTPDDTDMNYSYDLLGRLVRAEKNAVNISNFAWDALGRKVTESNYHYNITAQYDAAGRRTRLTWLDGFYVTYDYDVTGNMTAIRENGAASGVGVLASFAYDNLGRRASLTRGNGTVTSYAYDPVSRVATLSHDMTGAANDVSTSFTYNPASQIASSTRNNDLYALTGQAAASATYTNNGLNQTTSITGPTALTHDARGNIASIGGTSYSYTAQNRLAAIGSSILYADSLDRTTYLGATGDLIGHDGTDAVEERNAGSGVFLRRYVHGPGVDEPLVWFEGSGTSDRRWLHADEHGSIIAISDGTGAVTSINRYDEYGVPAATNAGRFGYTGQYWLGQGLWHYKARTYNPVLGRFMQTDPIGYGDGSNLYAYVGGDPVNNVDPTGTIVEGSEIVVNGQKTTKKGPSQSLINFANMAGLPGFNASWGWADNRDIDMWMEGERDQESRCIAGGGTFTAGSMQTGNGICEDGEIVVTAQVTPATRRRSSVGMALPVLIPYRGDYGFAADAQPQPAVDYCGSSGISRHTPERPGGYDVAKACKAHDVCFGPLSTTDRATCDKRFFLDVMNECRRSGGNNFVCAHIAVIYYGGVSLGGRNSYEGKGRR